MMLPELQDLADFDAPAYGQELAFLGDDDSDERLYLQDLADMLDTPALEDYGSDLGKCAVKSGRSKVACINAARLKEARRKKAAKATKKKADFEKAVKAEAAKRAPTPSRRRSSSRTSSRSRGGIGGVVSQLAKRTAKIKGVVQRGVKEAKVAQKVAQLERSGFDPQHQRLAKQDALNEISSRVKADIMPKLNQIYRMVDRGSLQTSATNEHNVIMNTQAYRRKVLNDIARISARLPKGHPLRNKMAARRRSLGLY